MKKLILKVLSLSLILLLAVSIFACKKEEGFNTKAPSKFKLNNDTLVLKWSTVSDARGYEIRISGDERIKTVKSPSYSLEYLKPGEYTIEVRALNFNSELGESDWSTFKFTREAESGLKYNLINNKTEYEVVGTGSAFGDVVMESVYRGKPVTQIADKAFASSKKITSLVIGSNVKTIGKNAFAKCSELTSVTIPESVTTIGEYAFQSCKKLTSINIPNNVTAIAPYTFSWCTALTTVTVGNSVQSIGENAFAECAALKSISLPDSVKTIGEYAFTNCAELSSVSLGNGMESVSEYCFYKCPSLTSLDLGNSIASIGLGAFGHCAALTSVTVPDSVTSIGAEAFAECVSLNLISLGSGLTQIGPFAFYKTIPHQIAHGVIAPANPDSSATENEPTATDIFYIGNWLIEAVDRDVLSFSLKEGTIGIADNAFQNCDSLDTVRLPGVKYIGSGAFSNCDKLRRAYTSDDLLIINSGAFYECGAFVNLSNAKNVVKIGDSAFENCSTLDDKGIDIPGPDVLKYLGSYAFRGTIPYSNSASPVICIDSWAVGVKDNAMFMGQVNVPDTNPTNNVPITAVGNYAFYGAMFLGGGVWLPNTVKYIGRGAFYDLFMMGGVGGAAQLEYIDDYAFYGCSSAWLFANPTETGVVQLPINLKHIGRSAFYQCTSLIGVKFPASVEYIGPYAFYGCSNLGDNGEMWGSIDDMREGLPTLKGPVIFANGSRLSYIGDRAFQGCTGIKEIKLPGALKYIGKSTFYGCEKLETVVFGNGDAMLSIPEYTFYECANLKNLTISQNIKSIGKYAFKNCASLENIVMGDSLESIGDYAFYGCVNVKSIVLSKSVKNIGKFAFKGCAKVDSVILPSSIETIGKHAFYGLHSATFFAEPDTIKPYWEERWNSSYRAILWGCELSDDKSYVISFTKGKNLYDNLSSPDATLTPERDGYTFAGWATNSAAESAEYTATQLAEIPDGATLYAVWTQNTTEE